MIMTGDKVTIKIPRPLYDKIQEVIDGAGFNSATDFIVYVLRDLVGELRAGPPREDRLSKEEIEAIRSRLKGLGYL